MPHSHRPLLVFAVVLALLGTAIPVRAHPSAAWPVLARKDMGADVRALEFLLRGRGEHLRANGSFEGETDRAVRQFQRRRRVGVDGIVGPNTWVALVPTIRKGRSGPEVRALQSLLVAKRGANVTVNGHFGFRTLKAVKRFQRHMRIGVDGMVGRTTWRNLLWHFDKNTPTAGVCPYSSDGRWGTAATIRHVRGAGARFRGGGRGRVAVGHISREHGGFLSPHVSHRIGLDADIRPARRDGRQCRLGTTWGSSTYGRRATRQLIRAIRKAAPQRVKVIWFNDPVLVRKGLTEHLSGHDDHLHVRYCSVGHRDINYRC